MTSQITIYGLPGSSVRAAFNILRHVFGNDSGLDSTQKKSPLELNLGDGQRVLFSDLRSLRRVREHDNSQKTGIILTDPVVRIAQAYRRHCESSTQPVDFDEFISNPEKRNVISRALGSLKPGEFSFIGLEERPVQTRLLLSHYLQLNMDWDQVPMTTEVSLTQSQIDRVRELNEDDMAVYEAAEEIFNGHWSQFQDSVALPVKKEKRVLIHCGPPKTGSSALQYWLSHERESLRRAGFFYPPHHLDNNSVSSGNFLSLLRQDKGNNIRFDAKRALALVEEFNRSDAHTLVLSSEYFFEYLPTICSAFPEAEFVFYIRNPIDKRESLYNQSVKRHHCVNKFEIPRSWRFLDLQRFDAVLTEFGNKVHYRYYHRGLLTGGNLISDFQEILGVSFSSPVSDQRINSSFSFEALQMMRLANEFVSGTLERELERWLQSVSLGAPEFTLLTKREQAEADKVLDAWVESFTTKRPFLSKEKLRYLLHNRKEKPYKSQELSHIDLTPLVQIMAKEAPRLLGKLEKACRQSGNFAGKRMLLDVLECNRPHSQFSFKDLVKHILMR